MMMMTTTLEAHRNDHLSECFDMVEETFLALRVPVPVPAPAVPVPAPALPIAGDRHDGGAREDRDGRVAWMRRGFGRRPATGLRNGGSARVLRAGGSPK